MWFPGVGVTGVGDGAVESFWYYALKTHPVDLNPCNEKHPVLGLGEISSFHPPLRPKVRGAKLGHFIQMPQGSYILQTRSTGILRMIAANAPERPARSVKRRRRLFAAP